MRPTGRQVNRCLVMGLCVGFLAAVSVSATHAADLLSREEAPPTNFVLLPLRTPKDFCGSPIPYKLLDVPSLHNYFLKFFSSLNSRPAHFLGFPGVPSSLRDIGANTGEKTGTAAAEENAQLPREPHKSEGHAKELAYEDDDPVSEPLKTSKIVTNVVRLGPWISMPFGFSETSTWLTSFLFHMWAALHPQDASYYVSLSQKASSPALTPVTGLHDMLSIQDRFTGESVTPQMFAAEELSGAHLQNLLLELITRTTGSAGISQTTGMWNN